MSTTLLNPIVARAAGSQLAIECLYCFLLAVKSLVLLCVPVHCFSGVEDVLERETHRYRYPHMTYARRDGKLDGRLGYLAEEVLEGGKELYKISSPMFKGCCGHLSR